MDKESARKCLRWERRLEMAMEGSRYFDLRRWGIASETLNTFFASEQNDSYTYVHSKTGEVITQPYAQYYKDAHYTAGKNEFFPIPYNQLFYIPGYTCKMQDIKTRNNINEFKYNAKNIMRNK